MVNTFLTSILYFILLNQTHYHFYTNAPIADLLLPKKIGGLARYPPPFYGEGDQIGLKMDEKGIKMDQKI